jgi:hypothetical protein
MTRFVRTRVRARTPAKTPVGGASRGAGRMEKMATRASTAGFAGSAIAIHASFSDAGPVSTGPEIRAARHPAGVIGKFKRVRV